MVVGLGIAYAAAAIVTRGPTDRRRPIGPSELRPTDWAGATACIGGILVTITGAAWWITSLF